MAELLSACYALLKCGQPLRCCDVIQAEICCYVHRFYLMSLPVLHNIQPTELRRSVTSEVVGYGTHCVGIFLKRRKRTKMAVGLDSSSRRFWTQDIPNSKQECRCSLRSDWIYFTVRSRAWVWSRSIPGIAGSNPAVRLLCLLYVV